MLNPFFCTNSLAGCGLLIYWLRPIRDPPDELWLVVSVFHLSVGSLYHVTMFWVNFITTSLRPQPGIIVRLRGIIPFYGRKIQVSAI